SCTCCPAGQFAIAVLIAAAVPVYGAMVGPHCVDLTGIVPAPARLQSMLLVGATIVCWASTDTEIVRTIRHTVSECRRLIRSSPLNILSEPDRDNPRR